MFQEFLVEARNFWRKLRDARQIFGELTAAKVSEQRIYFVGCLGFPRIQLTALKTLLIKPELSQLEQANGEWSRNNLIADLNLSEKLFVVTNNLNCNSTIINIKYAFCLRN